MKWACFIHILYSYFRYLELPEGRLVLNLFVILSLPETSRCEFEDPKKRSMRCLGLFPYDCVVVIATERQKLSRMAALRKSPKFRWNGLWMFYTKLKESPWFGWLRGKKKWFLDVSCMFRSSFWTDTPFSVCPFRPPVPPKWCHFWCRGMWGSRIGWKMGLVLFWNASSHGMTAKDRLAQLITPSV